MKKIILIFLILFLPGIVLAETNPSSEIILSALDTVKLAGHLVDSGKYDQQEHTYLSILNLHARVPLTVYWAVKKSHTSRKASCGTKIS